MHVAKFMLTAGQAPKISAILNGDELEMKFKPGPYASLVEVDCLGMRISWQRVLTVVTSKYLESLMA
jgi:hypothetical protein